MATRRPKVLKAQTRDLERAAAAAAARPGQVEELRAQRAGHPCWKCGTPPLTDAARKTIREAARREVLRLINRRPGIDCEGGRDPLPHDVQIAQLLLKGYDVDAIMNEILEPPTKLVQSFLRLALLVVADDPATGKAV